MLLLVLFSTQPHVWTRWHSPAICCTCEQAQSRHRPVPILPILPDVRKRFYKHCVCACSGWSESAGPVQQPAAEEPSQQVELRQLPLLGQLRRWDVRRVCVCMERDQHTGPHLRYLTDKIILGRTILQHKLKHTHTHTQTLRPPLPTPHPLLLCISPFSNLWLLYVKYIYVCIYTVYMYW